jgi:hypothetical protein
MSRFVRLYPRAWRVRYDAELEELVAARPLGVGGSIDLLRGALDAHRHPELVDPAIAPTVGDGPVSRQRYADLVLARRLGTAALFGALLWVAGWLIAANGPLVHEYDGTSYRDGAAAMPVVLGAMLLLSAGLLGQLIRLPAAARTARGGAIVAMLAGPFWAFAPWYLPVGFAVILGIAALAVGAWWRNAWSGAYALAVLVSITIGSVIVALAALGLAFGREGGIAVAVILLIPIWLGVGATLQSLPSVVDADPSDEPLAGPAPA